jgi:gamma-glutamyl-gamma-aminobutyrate hydrolase PuuD
MKHTRKAYVVGGALNYANWMECETVTDIRKADFVVFTGGEDVSPFLYGRKPHPTTYSSALRDAHEMDGFKIARDLNLPLCGICRGSQFLCVMAGGILVQHQQHPGRHKIHAIDLPDGGGERVVEISVTSTHHQRQFPWMLSPHERRLLGWCNLSPFSQGESDSDDLRFSSDDPDEIPEVEIAYYPKIRALAIQSHPEMCFPCHSKQDCEYISHCRMLLNRLLDGGLDKL